MHFVHDRAHDRANTILILGENFFGEREEEGRHLRVEGSAYIHCTFPSRPRPKSTMNALGVGYDRDCSVRIRTRSHSHVHHRMAAAGYLVSSK